MTPLTLFTAVLSFMFLTAGSAMAGTRNEEILNANRDAIVVIEGKRGDETIRGNGFIISQDGYVVSVAHLKHEQSETPRPTTLQAVIDGQRYDLEELDFDAASDVSLLRLTGFSTRRCRSASKMSLAIPKPTDPVVVLGIYDGNSVQAIDAKIIDPHGKGDYYRIEAPLLPGYSGAPVFDDNGQVIAIVQGGIGRGRKDVDLVPTSRLLNILLKFNINNVVVNADTECNRGKAAELFSARYYDFTISASTPKKVDVDLLHQGQEVSLCIGVLDAALTRRFSAMLLPVSAVADSQAEFGPQFQEIDRSCQLEKGTGALYTITAPREGKYQIKLMKGGQSWPWSSNEERIFLGVGFGTR